MSPVTTNHRSKRQLPTIMQTGLVAGALDASAAMIQYMINSHGDNPLKVWRYVASGGLGHEVLTSDLMLMASIGLVFHFIIAYSFTLLFFFIYPKIKLGRKNLVITGLAYGIFVWLVMNILVVPVSNVSAKAKLWAIVADPAGKNHAILQLPPNPKNMIIGLLIIMFCVGLPISLIIGRYYKKRIEKRE